MESLVLGESGEREKLEKERKRGKETALVVCCYMSVHGRETGESVSERRISKAEERGTAKLAGERGGGIISTVAGT